MSCSSFAACVQLFFFLCLCWCIELGGLGESGVRIKWSLKEHIMVGADVLLEKLNTYACALYLICLLESDLPSCHREMLSLYTFINSEMNCGWLHEGFIARKDEESETQGCGLRTDYCLKYQNTTMLRLKCVKNGEKFWEM
jgi:hypothetical protein